MNEFGELIDNVNNTLSGEQAVKTEISINLDMHDILSISGSVALGVLLALLIFEGIMMLAE